MDYNSTGRDTFSVPGFHVLHKTWWWSHNDPTVSSFPLKTGGADGVTPPGFQFPVKELVASLHTPDLGPVQLESSERVVIPSFLMYNGTVTLLNTQVLQLCNNPPIGPDGAL